MSLVVRRTTFDELGGTVWRSQAVASCGDHGLPTASLDRATHRLTCFKVLLRSNRIRRLAVSVALVVAAIPSSPRALASGDQDRAIPAEEQRLSPRVFRAGLKKRGLRQILEQHIRAFPPANLVASLLMMRDVHLAAWADPSLTTELRGAAVSKANDILAELLQQAGDDQRRFEWRYDLAHSLLYDEAEPFSSRILYLGGSADDHRQLRRIVARALDEAEGLTADLATEYERIDTLSVPEFDRLERSGFIETIDRLVPQADYLLMWTLYYDALAREDQDPLRADRLLRVLELFESNPAWLTMPHRTSRIQVQALLLAGMTHRLHNNHSAARKNLNRALAVAEGIDGPAEQQRIAWAGRLARIEHIRNETDDGRYDEALRGLRVFRRAVVNGPDHRDGSAVVAGLLERCVYRTRATIAEEAGRSAEANAYAKKSWESLARLVSMQDNRRDEVYSTLYSLIGPGADPAALDPLEHAALIAGLLADAEGASEDPNLLLKRTAEVGKAFLTTRAQEGKQLIPEVLFNTGVAQHRLGDSFAAARRFLAVATRFPKFERAAQSAVIAVQLSAEAYDSSTEHVDARTLYRDSLAALVERFPDTEEALYHRFFHAQLLDESGDYDEAATQYSMVQAGHEHFLEGVFRRIRCLASGLNQFAAFEPVDSLELQRRVNELLSARRGFVGIATEALGREESETRAAQIATMLATAQVLEAEVLVSPAVDRSGQALTTLHRFEESCPAEDSLTARVWRVRLLAYERLDRLDEAARALPKYVQADPRGAGATLQSLYESVASDADALLEGGDPQRAVPKAQTALLLAEQISTWARQPQSADDIGLVRAVTVQLAEANLRAGRPAFARTLFESVMGTGDVAGDGADSVDPRTRYGYAESLYQSGDYSLALGLFNRLAVRLPMDDVFRWKALLRDLQCRTLLGEPSKGIIRVILQQQYLDSSLGGPLLRPQFQALLRENERR